MANRMEKLSVTPTVNTAGGAHASGDLATSKMTFDLSVFRSRINTPIFLNNVKITDLSGNNVDYDLLLFHTDPGSTTFTLNAAFDLHDGDLADLITAVAVTDFCALADNGFAYKSDLATPIPLDHTASSMNLYACLVTRGTPTYGSTSDLVVQLTFSSDVDG